jgi:hypothetical protein
LSERDKKIQDAIKKKAIKCMRKSFYSAIRKKRTEMTKMENKELKNYLIFITVILTIFLGINAILTAYQIDLLNDVESNCQRYPTPNSDSSLRYADFSTADQCINALRQPEQSVRNSDITYDGEFRYYTIGVKFVQDYSIVCRGIDLISETPLGNASNRGFVENLCLNE